MIIELHAIQNFGPANLNRDDQGAPKTVDFGGATRGRVSSQSWKRAMRLYFAENESALVRATRTARAVSMIADRVVERDGSIEYETAARRAECILVSKPLELKTVAAKADDDSSVVTKQLIFLRDSDIDGLAGLAIELAEELDGQVKITGEGEKQKTEIQPGKFSKEVVKQIQSFFTSPDNVADVALFGRMIAELPEGNIDAACQVAHAIGTNAVEKEVDYFTAVDDLRPESTEGATMVGEIEFNSSCFYRYATLDTDQLAKNLASLPAAKRSPPSRLPLCARSHLRYRVASKIRSQLTTLRRRYSRSGVKGVAGTLRTPLPDLLWLIRVRVCRSRAPRPCSKSLIAWQWRTVISRALPPRHS